MNITETTEYYLDQVSTSVINGLYSTSTPPEVINGLFIIIISGVIITLGSFSTITKPNFIRESSSGLDVDDDPYIITNKLTYESILEIHADDNSTFNKFQIISIPLMASVSLVGLNYLIKNFDITMINYYLYQYIFVISPFIIYKSLEIVFVLAVRVLRVGEWLLPRYRLTMSDVSNDDHPVPRGFLERFKPSTKPSIKNYIASEQFTIVEPTPTNGKSLIFDTRPIYLLPITGVIYGLFLKFSHNWIISDIIGVLYSIYSINSLFGSPLILIELKKFKYLFLLLGLLFVYDIYFVFFSTIMETVATSITIPIKILIPGVDSATTNKFSILGLGDIILPGLLITLCLKFDTYQYYTLHPTSTYSKVFVIWSLPKVYFLTTLVSYIIGLIITLINLHYFKVGQPALLYLVPCTILNIMSVAIYRGELGQLWQFNDGFSKYHPIKDEVSDNEQDGDDEDDDEDYNVNSEDEEVEEFDEWVDNVEIKRYEIVDYDSADETELDEYRSRVVRYDFNEEEEEEEEEEDDTYVIGGNNDEEDDDDDELSEEEGDTEIYEELKIIKQDLAKDPREWYSEGEADEEEEDDGDDEQ